MAAYWGAAVVHDNTAYFSQDSNVYSYTLAKDEWIELQPCDYDRFGMAVVNDKVTTIGGHRDGRATNSLLCLEGQGTKWQELLPQMPTARLWAATVTTFTHLIVAGGRTGAGLGETLSTVELLDTHTLQWSTARNSPEALQYPHLSLCDEHLYLSEHYTIFSCSVEELVESCKPASTRNSDDDVWTKIANVPVPYYASLTILRGQIVAIGGSYQYISGTPTGAIHRYNRSTNSWSVIGEMPTPRSHPLVAVLSGNKLIAMGGEDRISRSCNITEIASIN